MTGPLLTHALDAFGSISLPGLGSFYSEPVVAQISFGEKRIQPASLAVTFVEDKTVNGEKLKNMLISDLRLTEKQAIEFIQKQTERIQSQLSQYGNFSIKGFGILQINSGGSLSFFPEAGIQFNAETYGLLSLPAETLQASVRREVEREIPVIPLRPFDLPETGKFASKNKKKSSFRWIAAAAVIAALAVSSTSIWYLSDQFNHQGSSFEPVAQEAGIISVPRQSPKVEPTKVHEPIAVTIEPTERTEKPTASAPAVAVKNNYYVIAGSFKQSEKSGKLQRILFHRGYDSQLLQNTEMGITRVSVGRFSSKEAALAFVRQAQELFDEQLWVMAQ